MWSYKGDDTISGLINVKLAGAKKIDHTGIKVELIGHIGLEWRIFLFFRYASG